MYKLRKLYVASLSFSYVARSPALVSVVVVHRRAFELPHTYRDEVHTRVDTTRTRRRGRRRT